ncbi:MAG: hypothetical protein II629_07605, partial [Ruminococcus sp.]|nr:hypothetical protein [Ruminococcus sp.]
YTLYIIRHHHTGKALGHAGGYERVYDKETGNIYRAYNGFLDDIGDQSRYTPITDNQYAEGYDGWIDK